MGHSCQERAPPSQHGFPSPVLGLQTQAQPVPIPSPAGETPRRGLEMGNSSMDKLCSHMHSMDITQQLHNQQRKSKTATSGLSEREGELSPLLPCFVGKRESNCLLSVINCSTASFCSFVLLLFIMDLGLFLALTIQVFLSV